MARVQLLMPDEDRSRFVYQAHQEGMSLSARLRAAARERLERQSQVQPFESVADLEAFFVECDLLIVSGSRHLQPLCITHHTATWDRFHEYR